MRKELLVNIGMLFVTVITSILATSVAAITVLFLKGLT